ncbi:MAG: TonB family protein [Nitrospirae bacterium]|nr:TonB family protein [Nitrospirota bacterium]
MVFNRSILFSIILHVMIVTAAIAINGRGREYHAPADHILVLLFSDITGSSPTSLKEVKIEKSVAPGKKEIRETITKKDNPVISLSNEALNSPVVRNAEEVESKDIMKFGSAAVIGNPNVSSGQTPMLHSSTKGNKNNPPSPPFDKGGMGGFSEQNMGIKWEAAVYDSPKIQSGENSGSSNKGGAQAVNLLIRAAIEKVKTYPVLAMKRRIEGILMTEFIINSKGYSENVAVAKSSGYEILDSAAIAIIKRAAPFPKVEGQISIPITFSLKNTGTYE